jgi:hypothetical protein
MIDNRKLFSTIKISVLGCDVLKFGRDESRKKKAVASIFMLKIEAGMNCEIW